MKEDYSSIYDWMVQQGGLDKYGAMRDWMLSRVDENVGKFVIKGADANEDGVISKEEWTAFAQDAVAHFPKAIKVISNGKRVAVGYTAVCGTISAYLANSWLND